MPVGLAVLREQHHEIDVGREIELAAAELAHAEDQQRQTLALRVDGRPVPRGELALGPCVRGTHADIGERARLAQDGPDIGDAGEIAPRDPRQVQAPEDAQRVEPGGILGRVRQH